MWFTCHSSNISTENNFFKIWSIIEKLANEAGIKWIATRLKTSRELTTNAINLVQILYSTNYLFASIESVDLNDVQMRIDFTVSFAMKEPIYGIEELKKGEYCHWNEILTVISLLCSYSFNRFLFNDSHFRNDNR